MKYDNNSLKNYFEKNYSLGKAITIKEIKHNDINSKNYLVTTKKGRFAIRKFKNDYNPRKIEKICHILNRCIQKEIKVLEPIKNNFGYYVDKKNNIFLTKYYEGSFFKGEIIEIKEFAKQLAILHRHLKQEKTYGFKSKKTKYKILNCIEIEKISKIIHKKKNMDKYDQSIQKYIRIIEDAITINNKFQNKISLKTRNEQLIHHDLHPKNILFLKNKVNVILDFNSLQCGNIVDDIAFAGYRLAMHNNSNPKIVTNRFNIFYKSYCKHNAINVKTEYLGYVFLYETLRRISYILRNRYFFNSNSWILDFQKQVKFLKIILKIVEIRNYNT